MKQLSSVDAQMFFIETPVTPNHVAFINIYDQSTVPGGRIRFKQILSHIESRLHRARMFRRKLVRVPFDLDDPYWIDDENFDLEYHVRHIALPKPGDWRQFCIQCARLNSRPLDMSRAPWEITVIEGLDKLDGVPEGAFAIFFKIHHCAIDGVAGVELQTALHDLEPVPAIPDRDSADSWSPEAEPSQWRLLGAAAIGNAVRPAKMLRAAGRLIPGVVRASRANVELPPLRVPMTRFNRRASPHRVFDRCKFPLAEIKRIRRVADGVTVNDVAAAIVSGGLRRYLNSKGELPGESMVALVPISTRTADQASSEGNLVTMLTSSLCTDITDPVERLKGIHNGMCQTKAFAEALGARQLTEMSAAVPGLLQGLAARASARVGAMTGTRLIANTLVTNVPGPQQPLYFAGARCVDMTGMAPLGPNMNLVNGILSYCGELVLNIAACRDALPDPWFYTECLCESYRELLVAADD